MEILVLILIGYLFWKEKKSGDILSCCFDKSLPKVRVEATKRLKIPFTDTLGKISAEELQADMARVLNFWNIILRETERTGINPCIIAGIIHRESQGKQALIAGKPATYGLMQLQERTARMHGLKGSVAKLFDPEINIKAGVNYYVTQVKRYKDWVKAISAYNAGHATTKNKAYVQDIIELSNIYCSLSPSL